MTAPTSRNRSLTNQVEDTTVTELRQFVAMLSRAGVGHGLRHDHNPPGTAVQVETGESESDFMVTEFAFDGEGKLTEVVSYPGEVS